MLRRGQKRSARGVPRKVGAGGTGIEGTKLVATERDTVRDSRIVASAGEPVARIDRGEVPTLARQGSPYRRPAGVDSSAGT